MIADVWLSTLSVLGLGFALGLKHALDADHLAAVSTLVSERKSLLGSSIVGALWGLGHTIALLAAGIGVILLHVEIGRRTAQGLEFGVAVMLIALGANALWKLGRGGRLHMHAHEHSGRVHLHPHVHDESPRRAPYSHHDFGFTARPVLVGMMHGLAGSAAVMLLVLSTIRSPLVGFAYIAVFGVGSIGGMLCMSALVSVPFHLTSARFVRAHVAVRALAGIVSLGCGLLMAYDIGFAGGLFL